MSRVASLVLVAALLAVLCFVRGRTSSETGLSLELVDSVRAALQRAQQADEFFASAQYGRAASILEETLSGLPTVGFGVPMSALLGLDSAEDYRRIVAGLYCNLGLCRLRLGQFETAVECLQKAVSITRTRQAQVNLGIALVRLKRFDSAIPVLEEALAQASGPEADTFLYLGQAYLSLGRSSRARWALHRARWLALRSDSVRSWGTALEAELLLASAYRMDGDVAGARKCLESVLERAPGEVRARYGLYRILRSEGQDAEAEPHRRRFLEDSKTVAAIQSVLSANRREVSGLRWVADSYRRLGLYHLAEVHYRQLWTREPENLELLAEIRDLKSRIGKRPVRARPDDHGDGAVGTVRVLAR